MKRVMHLIIGMLLVGSTMLSAQDAPAQQSQPTLAAPQKQPGNARVTFALMPLGPDDKDVFIVSNGDYATSRKWENANSSSTFDVKGALELLADGRLNIRFDATLRWEGETDTAEFQVHTNLLLIPNKEIEVARFGDKTLVVSFNTP